MAGSSGGGEHLYSTEQQTAAVLEQGQQVLPHHHLPQLHPEPHQTFQSELQSHPGGQSERIQYGGVQGAGALALHGSSLSELGSPAGMATASQRPQPKPRVRRRVIDASNQSSTSQDVHSTPSFPQSSLGSLPAPLLPMPQSGSATATTDTVVVSTSASEAPQSVCMPFDGSGHDIALEALRQRRLELKQQHEQTLLVKSNNSTPVVNEAQTEIFSASTINVSPSSRSQPHHQPQNVPVLSDINYAELESKLQSLEPLHGLQQASFRDDTSGAKHSATSEQHYDLMLGNTLPSSESKNVMDTEELENGSDSDTESICSTISASSSVVSLADKTKFRARFPPFISTKQLYRHFTHCGFDESEVHIQRYTNHTTGKPAGSAIIIVSSETGDFKSLVNGTLLLDKHKLKVEVYHKKQRKKQNKKNVPKQMIEQSPTLPNVPSTNTETACFSSLSSNPCRIFVGSGLPTYINEQHIREHFNRFEKDIIRVDTIKDKETKKPKGFFFVTFKSLASAEMAVQNLHHSLLLGEHRIKVEKQRIQPQQSTSVNPPQALSSLGRDFGKPPQAHLALPCLIVDNLDPSISNDEIKALVGVRFTEMRSTGSCPNQRCFQFYSDHDALMAKTALDGKNFLGKVVRAVIPGNISPQSDLNSHQPLNSPPKHHLPVHQPYRQRVPQTMPFPVPSSPPTHSQNRHPHVQLLPRLDAVPRDHSHTTAHTFPPHQTYSETYPSGPPLVAMTGNQNRERKLDGDIKLLELQPHEWNQLMTVQSNGTSLYQEIITPFKANPHVTIEIIPNSCTVKISGVPEAVTSAFDHFQHHMSKTIKVTDRIKMEALVEVFPTLPMEIHSKYGITMDGYAVDSTEIQFSGPPQAKMSALTEVNSLLLSAIVECVDVKFSLNLILSLRKRLTSDGIRTFVKLCPTGGLSNQVMVCSFDKSMHERAMKLVRGNPITNKVNASLADIEELAKGEVIKSIEEESIVSIKIEEENTKFIIHGFLRSDIQAARMKLIGLVNELSKKRQLRKFTPEELMYLKYQFQTSPDLFSDIPVEFKGRGTVEFSGNPETVQRIVDGPLLTDLQWKRFQFQCNPRFIELITRRVLLPLKDDQTLNFLYLVDKPAPDSKRTRIQGKQNQGRHPEHTHFIIVVYSKDSASFLQVCASLEGIEPTSKRYNFRYRESQQCVNAVKMKLERVYPVQLNESEERVYINGLTPVDVQKCWEDIDEEIKSTVVLTKTISSTVHESRYLKEKYSEELRVEYSCEVFYSKERSELRVKGKLKDIERVESRVSEILESGLHVEKFTISCNGRHFPMWWKWWMEFKRQKDDTPIVLNFFRKDRRRSSSSESEQVADVEIIGTDSDQLIEIKETLCSKETEERIVEVPSAGATALLTAKKQGRLNFLDKLTVVIFIDSKSNKAILTSPKEKSDDLDTAEEEIQKFVGNHTSTHTNVTSEEPVVGLVLCSKTKGAPYLTNANAIAKQHKVSVHPLKSPKVGLKLTGSKAVIEKVATLIRGNVLMKIEGNVQQIQVTVDRKYSSLLISPEFQRFESKLKENFCVICSYPKLGKLSRAIHSAVLQSSSSANRVQIDLCRGSIVYEKVDAIVNPANEDLQHAGGLAKVIVDAAGLAVQTESTEYVQRNGRLFPGACVALSAGGLPCKRIIHAVGPRWVDGTKGEESTLYLTIYSCLQCADREKLTRIAFPAISTGIFQVPEDVCARVSLQAVRDYVRDVSNSSLSTVRFVLFTPTVFESFKNYFKSVVLPSAMPSATQTSRGHADFAPMADVKTPSTAGQQAPADSSSSFIPTVFGSLKSLFRSSVPPPPMPDTKAPSSSNQWFWADDRRSFTAYPPDITTRLNLQYQQNPQGSFRCIINRKMYLIDFSTMTQRNISTGFERKIRFQSSMNQGKHWEYANDHGSWSQYQPHESQTIESHYQGRSPCQLNINGNWYLIDYAKMCQINLSTNNSRRIRQVVPTSHPHASPTAHQHTDMLDHGQPDGTAARKPSPGQKPTNEDVTVVLRGPADSLPQAKQTFEDKLKSMFKSHSVAFPSALERKLCKVIRKHNVISSVEDVAAKGNQRKPQKVFRVEGLASNVDRAITAIQEEIIKNQLESEEDDSTQYPPEWVQQSRTTQVFQVQPGTNEWNKVTALFKTTMPHSNILQVERIQNKWLWDRYVFQRKRLGIKNGGQTNEIELFHGTRSNDPKVIYENEDGFDMRYSAQGMWGQANYFAVNASYSHNYAYATSDGYREIFLVKVLTGDSFDSPSNRSLRKPPMKATGGSGEVSFAQMQYDTVTGVTGGSRVYMTYDNDKAYPAYLIKYS